MTKHDEISAIARQNLGLLTLAAQNSDSLDFHEHGVWQVEAALDAAYRAGQRDLLAAAEALLAAKDNQMETITEWRALRKAIKAARKNV
jgi:hypothetical protein